MTREILVELADAVAGGKAERDSPYPPERRGEDGAAEICLAALAAGVSPEDVLRRGLVAGMQRVGERFARGEAFIPEVLLAAKAMRAALAHLEPRLAKEEAGRRGTVVLGTVAGDIHDLGKNLVGMVLQGAGWRVVDLGVDVSADRFAQAVRAEHPRVVGLSALLTTTMAHLGPTVERLRREAPGLPVYVGGAPVTPEFAERIGAAGTFPDAFAFARHLGEAG